jgi:hypothetical protein
MGTLERIMDWINRRDRTLAGAGHAPGDTSLEPAVAEFDEELERGAEEADAPEPDAPPPSDPPT